MDFIIKPLEETPFTYEDVIILLHAAFQERLDQGLSFTTSRMSASDFRKKAECGTVLVAFNPITNDLLGTGMIHIKKDETGISFADLEHKGVSPNIKRSGIGSALETELQHIAVLSGAHYLVSDTALKAHSSIRFHIQNGYYKWKVVSFPSTDYFSVVFRKQIQSDNKQNVSLSKKAYYCISLVRTLITRKKDGTQRKWVSIIRG